MRNADPPDIPPVQTPNPTPPVDEATDTAPPRRRTLRMLAAGLLAAIIAIPGVIGGLFAFDPVLRKRKPRGGDFVRIADLSAVPDDGTPRAFPVIADQVDGWTGTPDVEIGLVYVRKAEDGVVAWNARCPHLGCLIEYKDESDNFLCPCHSSVFAVDGSRENDVSPRAMDSLPAEVRDGAVFVEYREFKYRLAEKVPVA